VANYLNSFAYFYSPAKNDEDYDPFVEYNTPAIAATPKRTVKTNALFIL